VNNFKWSFQNFCLLAHFILMVTNFEHFVTLIWSFRYIFLQKANLYFGYDGHFHIQLQWCWHKWWWASSWDEWSTSYSILRFYIDKWYYRENGSTRWTALSPWVSFESCVRPPHKFSSDIRLKFYNCWPLIIKTPTYI